MDMAIVIAAMKVAPPNPLPLPEVSVIKYLEQLISKIIEVKLSTSAGKSQDSKPVAPGDNKPEDVAAEASRLEFKTVNEMYVSNN
jgi:hypothetical protein